MAAGILRPKNSKINTRQQLKRERATLTANYCAHFRMESIEKHITILHKIKVFRLYIKSELEVERERETGRLLNHTKHVCPSDPPLPTVCCSFVSALLLDCLSPGELAATNYYKNNDNNETTTKR